MGDAWMPGAGRLQASADGGELQGGAPRVVWRTLEADPRLVSARSAAQHLDQLGHSPHLVWNPLSGEIVQLIPVVRAARSLCGSLGLISAGACCPAEASGLNREGRLCVQVAVISFASDPFTLGPVTGLERIVWWLDGWRIPRWWPAGPPAAPAYVPDAPRSRRLWARGGHFGSSQVPGCIATGPGRIDVERLTDPAAIPAIGAARRARDVPALPRRDKPAARGGTIKFRHHQQEEAEAQLTTAG